MNIELDFNFSFKAIEKTTQLVIIPVNEEYGVVAVVKPLEAGKAACIVFSPATKLEAPFDNFRPTFLRKMITTDFPLREGRWKSLAIENSNALSLRTAVEMLFKDFEQLSESQIQVVDMERPTNTSSAPNVASATYRAPDYMTFELAAAHLVGFDYTIARVRRVNESEAKVPVAAVQVSGNRSAQSDAAPMQANTASSAVDRNQAANAPEETGTIEGSVRTGKSIMRVMALKGSAARVIRPIALPSLSEAMSYEFSPQAHHQGR